MEKERLAKAKALEEKLARKNKKEKEETFEDKMRRLYKFLTESKNSKELMKKFRELVGLPDDVEIDFDTFLRHMEDFRNKHMKCGEDGMCSHLKRFYDRIGFDPRWINRTYLKMKTGKVHDFTS